MIKKYTTQKDSDNLRGKLAAYSALAGTFLTAAPSSADAGIVYTDINPDTVLALNPVSFALDLDNNGITDFNFNFVVNSYTIGTFQYMAQGAAVELLGANEVMGTSSYASVLNNGAAISAGQSWIVPAFYSYGLLGVAITSMYSGMSYNYFYGNWLGQTDKFLGVKFDINGQTHYGWVRLDMKGDGTSVKIKDFAYEDVPNMPINAGDMGGPVVPADTVSTVAAADVADNGNSADLEVSFTKAMDESTVAEYRIIVVKSPDAATFDLTAANAVVPTNVVSVQPTGSNIAQVLPVNARDKDGDPITVNVAYKAFVLSLADGVNANANALSTESNEITLNAPIISSDPATNVSAMDVADNGNGSDLQVSFDKAADETKVGAYRIIVVKSADAAAFDLTAAEAVTEFTEVVPTGSNVSQSLQAGSKDKDGDLISTAVPYKVLVLSIADGVNAQENVLSNESNEVTLDEVTGILPVGDRSSPRIYFSGAVLFVEIPGRQPEVGRLMVVNAAGQTMVEFHRIDANLRISTESWAPGVYYTIYTAGEKQFTQPLFFGSSR